MTARMIRTFARIACAAWLAGTAVAAPPVTAEPSWPNLMVGDWTLVGTRRESPTAPDLPVVWKMHGRRILGGAFVQVEHRWTSGTQVEHSVEIVAYHGATHTHASSGFSDDGSTWVATGSYEGSTLVEVGTTTGADGRTSKWRDTYQYDADGTGVTGSEESEQDGIKWTSFHFKGMRARQPAQRR